MNDGKGPEFAETFIDLVVESIEASGRAGEIDRTQIKDSNIYELPIESVDFVSMIGELEDRYKVIVPEDSLRPNDTSTAYEAALHWYSNATERAA